MHIDWSSFLTSQSALIEDGLVQHFSSTQGSLESELNQEGFCDLSELAILEVNGTDASDFLHGQLCSDIKKLQPGQSQLSGWCNIKGRVITTFLLHKKEDGFFLLLDRNLNDSISKRLRMFVLRSDVTVTDKSNELVCLGVYGDQMHKCLQDMPDTHTTLSPISGASLSVVISDVAKSCSVWTQLSALADPGLAVHWQAQAMQLGMPWIDASNSEEFLPQTLNMDLIGALSFDKGCYPGQEIVARMHFRGKLKQRAFLGEVQAKTEIVPQTKLFSESVEAHTGMVINAVAKNAHNTLILFSSDLAHRDTVSTHLEHVDGPAVHNLALPYSLKRNIN